MAYSLRKDPETFTPYTDDNENSRRTVGRVTSIYGTISGGTTSETQTLQFSHIEQYSHDYVYTKIDTHIMFLLSLNTMNNVDFFVYGNNYGSN